MNWADQCAVVIPCANEGGTIFELVSGVRGILPSVIVVDDGSIDETGAKAAKAGAEVIRHERSKGKGAALNAGWRRAMERGFTWVLSMDGDGQHAVKDISTFLVAAEQGNVDLVAGNRMGCADRMPWLRRRVNQWMSRKLSRAAGIDLADSQCGFRLMRLSAWSTLRLQAEHFEIESEVLLAFVARKYAVEFVPVQVIYKDELSKIHPARDTVRWFRWWRKARPLWMGQSPQSGPADAGESEEARSRPATRHG